jgi:hypothetical protein
MFLLAAFVDSEVHVVQPLVILSSFVAMFVLSDHVVLLPPAFVRRVCVVLDTITPVTLSPLVLQWSGAQAD